MKIDIEDEELEALRKKKMNEMMRGKNEKEGNKKHRIIVYMTESCPYCHATVEYLKARGIEFEIKMVDRDYAAAMEMVQKSGQMGVPVIDIDGGIIIGFNRPAIDMALSS